MDSFLLPETLMSLLKTPRPPVVVDVRKRPAFESAPAMLPGAVWRDPHAVEQWAPKLPSSCSIVVYCVHGHEVSQGVRDALRRRGVMAGIIEGGIEGWRAAGGPVVPNAGGRRTMKWVTRARPVIDRIACPWLIARFIDKEAEFLFVAPDRVQAVAEETGAIPYDVPGVELTHVGEGCSFDTFLLKYRLDDPALHELARIVRGADTQRLDLTPQSAGLLAISLGLRSSFEDDLEVLRHGFVLYDALYRWCRELKGETHSWPPKMTA